MGPETLDLHSSRSVQLIDITGRVKDFVQESGVDNGIVVIITPHTTAGITINENADPDVRGDIETFLNRHFPHQDYFRHQEGNSPAHLMSSFFSASEILMIENGRLLLGTWQGIYFCEFDGPRNRQVRLKAIRGG